MNVCRQSPRASSPSAAAAWKTWVSPAGNASRSKVETSATIGSIPASRNRASSPGVRHRAIPNTSWSRASSRAIGNATRPVAPVTSTRHVAEVMS